MLKRLITSTALALALAIPTVAGAANSANIDSKKLLDANVRNVNGDKVGEIDGVILDNAGKTQAVVVEVGGFLGMGERHVALNWNALTVSENGDKVTTQYTKDQLKSMPEYKIDQKRRETAYNDPGYHPVAAVENAANRVADSAKKTMGDHKWAKASGNLKASELIGADIVNAKNDEIGNVKEVLFDTTGKIKTLLVDPQGIMNGGTKTVAIDLSKVEILQSGDDLRLSTSMTEEQLKALPEYKSMAAGSASTSAGGMAKPTTDKK